MSDWPPGKEGGGAGGAGQKMSNPLPPALQRPLLAHAEQDLAPAATSISQPKVLRPAVFNKVRSGNQLTTLSVNTYRVSQKKGRISKLGRKKSLKFYKLLK